MSADVRADQQRRGATNGRTLLTEAEVRGIRLRLAVGDSRSAVAAAYRVSKSTVQSIAEGRSWSWLT